LLSAKIYINLQLQSIYWKKRRIGFQYWSPSIYWHEQAFLILKESIWLASIFKTNHMRHIRHWQFWLIYNISYLWIWWLKASLCSAHPILYIFNSCLCLSKLKEKYTQVLAETHFAMPILHGRNQLVCKYCRRQIQHPIEVLDSLINYLITLVPCCD
jgi:hypothetical protein